MSGFGGRASEPEKSATFPGSPPVGSLRMHVVVTGAAGNLGTKVVEMLQGASWCTRITGIDVVPFTASGKATSVVADLVDAYDERWIKPVREAQGIVHYASANPAPTGTWAES